MSVKWHVLGYWSCSNWGYRKVPTALCVLTLALPSSERNLHIDLTPFPFTVVYSFIHLFIYLFKIRLAGCWPSLKMVKIYSPGNSKPNEIVNQDRLLPWHGQGNIQSADWMLRRAVLRNIGSKWMNNYLPLSDIPSLDSFHQHRLASIINV